MRRASQDTCGTRVLGSRRRHLGKTVELAARLFLDTFGMPAASIFSPSSSISFVWSSPFAQLFLNRLHLLAEKVFALVLADFRLDL
jgi:hypothetical protein